MDPSFPLPKLLGKPSVEGTGRFEFENELEDELVVLLPPLKVDVPEGLE